MIRVAEQDSAKPVVDFADPQPLLEGMPEGIHCVGGCLTEAPLAQEPINFVRQPGIVVVSRKAVGEALQRLQTASNERYLTLGVRGFEFSAVRTDVDELGMAIAGKI